MRIFIKNMLNIRCKILVKTELEKLGIPYISVEQGEVLLSEQLSPQRYQQLKDALSISGFEVIDDKKSLLIQKIKQLIIDMVLFSDELPVENYSSYISKKLNYNYTYLANLFSEIEGITIEHFIISNKIEKVKELLLENELNLTQIAEKMHYSSVAHLSNQFKKVTGLTPTNFKNIKENIRNSGEKL